MSGLNDRFDRLFLGGQMNRQMEQTGNGKDKDWQILGLFNLHQRTGYVILKIKHFLEQPQTA
jgi:hypothetical protein